MAGALGGREGSVWAGRHLVAAVTPARLEAGGRSLHGFGNEVGRRPENTQDLLHKPGGGGMGAAP